MEIKVKNQIANRPSLRTSINEKCKDCAYDHIDRGTWLQQVDACSITHCPLHPVRPRSSAPMPE